MAEGAPAYGKRRCALKGIFKAGLDPDDCIVQTIVRSLTGVCAVNAPIGGTHCIAVKTQKSSIITNRVECGPPARSEQGCHRRQLLGIENHKSMVDGRLNLHPSPSRAPLEHRVDAPGWRTVSWGPAKPRGAAAAACGAGRECRERGGRETGAEQSRER